MSQHAYQKVKPGKCESLLNGQVKLRNSERGSFSTSSQVNGQFIAEKTTIPYALEVNGQAECRDCIFKKEVLLRGDASLSGCAFHADLEILNNRIELNACKAGSVYLTSPGWISLNPFVRQKIYLRKGSRVDYISFNNPGGKVYCFDGSDVIEVRNGKVIKH